MPAISFFHRLQRQKAARRHASIKISVEQTQISVPVPVKLFKHLENEPPQTIKTLVLTAKAFQAVRIGAPIHPTSPGQGGSHCGPLQWWFGRERGTAKNLCSRQQALADRIRLHHSLILQKPPTYSATTSTPAVTTT